MARPAPWHGEVVSIHIAPKAEDPMRSIQSVRAIAGRGLEGDRYFRASGTYSDRPGPAREITLIESEAIARSEEHTSELQSLAYLVCRLLLEKKKQKRRAHKTQ